MPEPSFSARTLPSLSGVSPKAWDTLANPAGQPYNPFVSHTFLNALEESGSATPETGWAPSHVLLELEGKLVGAAPAYLKSHSQGEYVFDHGWADAFERAGGTYFPKLQCSVPFTPATGPRLLVAPGENESLYRTALASALVQVTDQHELSSLHITFLPKQDWEALGQRGFLQRTDQQFHWENAGYGKFEDFLSALSSAKRKTLRKERARAVEAGLEIEWLTGADITEAHWNAFWVFYQDTGSRKWGRPYLTRAFFSLVGARMADDILLIFAKRNGVPIAGALNFIGGDTLFGRYWGCTEHHKFLHFEISYYQAIDFAIQKGLARVEAGAQGEHKLARGYLPVTTYSAHWISNPHFRAAVSDYLDRERNYIAEDMEVLKEHTPFRKE
ncbi:N-acetyltransferase [bacterium AH-315-P15]|nr:N-acetyltransferase [bacterium AH-315-P15]